MQTGGQQLEDIGNQGDGEDCLDDKAEGEQELRNIRAPQTLWMSDKPDIFNQGHQRYGPALGPECVSAVATDVHGRLARESLGWHTPCVQQ